VTGIAASKWRRYGAFFVEVLRLVAEHCAKQRAGLLGAEDEINIDFKTLPGWAPSGSGGRGGGGGGAGGTSGGVGVVSEARTGDWADAEEEDEPPPHQQGAAAAAAGGGGGRGASALYQQFAYNPGG
jgi:hypothetical protein